MSLNLAEILAISACDYSDKPAVVCEGYPLTYGNLASAARRLANVLHKKGVGPGRKVAFMLPNTPHFPIVLYGILWAGATAVPINALLQTREILFQLDDSESDVFFVHEALSAPAAAAFTQSQCKHLVVVEQGMSPGSPAAGESFLNLMSGVSDHCDMAQTNPDDTAEVIYTAATSGYPMGAELTHFNLFQNTLACKEFLQHYTAKDVCLNVLPLFHTFGQTAMLNAPIMAGSTVLMPIRFDAGRVIDMVCRERVTLLGVVPTMVHYLLQFKKDHPVDFSSIRAVIAGGAKLPLDLAARFKDRFGKTLLEGYGLTETSPVVAYNTDEATNRSGSVGRPIWHCRVAIERPDGAFAGTGEIGEVLVRGHNVMKGYYQQPGATREALRNGWLHTGDMGYLDADGYLFLTGVKKDLIIRAGLNIYPAELEMVMRECPGVADVAVVGLADPIRGDEVCAAVLPGDAYEEKKLRTHCLGQLASYKCPKRFVCVESLPKKSDGTTDKTSLKAALMAGLRPA